MADSVSQISKNHEKSKYVNSVNRTTSETLRLTDTERSIVQPTSLNVSASNPKKKTSFQITSVTVGSRMSNDGGDDSADDLDESHTDDVSEVNDTSRATDLERETPSYSEDTFSKDDVFFNASTSLAPAPVIPTSSQYGLAILDSSEAGEVVNPSDGVSNMPDSELGVVTEKVINLVSAKHDPEVIDSPHSHTTRSERFKVVKIESTEPFKRGRWVCMDYLDHNTVSQTQQAQSDSTESPSQPEPASEVKNTTTIGHEEAHPIEPSNTISASTQIDSSQISSNQPINMGYSSSPGQSLQSSIQINTNSSQVPQPQVTHGQSLSQISVPHSVPNHTSLQPQQMQQVVASANSVHPGSSLPQQMPQTIQQQFQQQQQFLQQQQQAAVLQQQQQQAAVLQQQQISAQQQQMSAQQQLTPQQQQQLTAQQQQQQQLNAQQQMSSQQQLSAQQQMSQQQQQQITAQQQLSAQQQLAAQQQPQFTTPPAHTLPMTGIPPMAFPANTTMVHQAFVPPTQYYPGTATTGHFVPTAIIPGAAYPTPVLPTVSATQQPVPPVQSAQPTVPPTVNPATFPSPPYPNVETPSEVSSDPVTPGILDGLAPALDDAPPTGEDPNSAPGASAVAIDNKIEQAMDLVKSHLMFAVREEVEVLKEKISELMERISQLEAENGILRAAASQETLAALPPASVTPMPTLHQPPQTNNSS